MITIYVSQLRLTKSKVWKFYPIGKIKGNSSLEGEWLLEACYSLVNNLYCGYHIQGLDYFPTKNDRRFADDDVVFRIGKKYFVLANLAIPEFGDAWHECESLEDARQFLMNYSSSCSQARLNGNG